MKTIEEAPLPAPSPHLAGLRPYVGPQVDPLIELPLDGTERPVLSAELRAMQHVLTADSTARYPDKRAMEAALAARFSIDPSRVLVTAGADEVLDRACRAFLCPGRTLVKSEPTFEMIPYFAQLAGAGVVSVPWERGAYPTAAVIAAITRDTHIVAIVSPNNPTGLVVHAQDIVQIARAAPHALVVVDMAYSEFAEQDLSATVMGLRNTVMVRTLSKAWAMPGVRLGYAIAHPEVIALLRTAGCPYTVPRTSLAVAHSRLGDGDAEMRAYVDRIRQERRQLADTLTHLGAAEVLPSQANFVLARFADAKFTQRGLASLGIACRAFASPALANARRITCPGDPDAFARLTQALHAVLAPQALLFDMDGVLADVSASYRAAIVGTAAHFGVALSREQIATAKASGNANNDWQLTHRLLAQHDVNVSLEAVTEVFERLYQGDAAQPGLRASERLLCERATLEALRAHRPLAVVTGRPRQDAERFLRDAGIADLFKIIVCMEDAELKPNPASVVLALRQLGVSSAWMLGDTPDDVRAARGAHVMPIGIVAPGDDAERSGGVLQRAGAACIITHIAELEEMLP